MTCFEINRKCAKYESIVICIKLRPHPVAHEAMSFDVSRILRGYDLRRL